MDANCVYIFGRDKSDNRINKRSDLLNGICSWNEITPGIFKK